MALKRLYFRTARAKDEATVIRFTRQTFQHGDYISLVWKGWLNDPQGRLLAASIAGQAVAVAHIAMLSTSEAWLEGLRVDPDFRRSGIATKLILFGQKKAIQMGARILRFITSSDNLPVHTISANLGFERTLVLPTFQALPVQRAGIPLPQASSSDLPLLQEFISKSQMLHDMKGLVGSGWQFSSLEGFALKTKIEAGQCVVIKENEQIQALAVIERREHDNSLAVCYADGFPFALERLLAALLQQAFFNKQALISAKLPENCSAGPIFEKAGFRLIPDEAFWVFEKRLIDPL